MDDEKRLIEIVQEYCRLARRSAELFFDGAPQPETNNRKNGLVHVHFVKLGYSADDAMIHYLHNLAKDRSNLAVVSSDHRIRNAALSVGCKSISSDAFAREMTKVFSSEIAVQETKNKTPSTSEVEEWLNLFDQNCDQKYS
jgi:predicted RNA-binding protein with PIN domain